MGRKFVFILKLLVGAYLIFVGVTLLRTILDVRPSNFQIMCVTSAIFILIGAGYTICLLGSTLKRKMHASAPKQQIETTGMPMEERPGRNQAAFRTVPMTIQKEEQQDTIHESNPHQERKIEEQSPDRTSERNSATVQLQTVGPDTMVWKNDSRE